MQKIREIMDQTGITWPQVAEQIGVDRVTLWRWRTRKGGIRQTDRERIAKAVYAILQQRGEGGPHA